MNDRVYIKINKQNKVYNGNVLFLDVFQIYSVKSELIEEIGHIQLTHLEKGQRLIMNSLEVLNLVGETFPEVEVCFVGECEFLVECCKEEKKSAGLIKCLKTFCVCVVSLVGAGYGIVAYNNDVSTIDIFDRVYRQLGATAYENSKIMEVAYALGLFIGIVLFFDHFAGHRISKSPTPIEVAMDQYDEDLVDAVISREKNNCNKKSHGKEN